MSKWSVIPLHSPLATFLGWTKPRRRFSGRRSTRNSLRFVFARRERGWPGCTQGLSSRYGIGQPLHLFLSSLKGCLAGLQSARKSSGSTGGVPPGRSGREIFGRTHRAGAGSSSTAGRSARPGAAGANRRSNGLRLETESLFFIHTNEQLNVDVG